ncbi:MAG: AAA family ATPase [Nitrospirae bacterium]|nr:AAA family ATPase [Nitrospirota bacterium]
MDFLSFFGLKEDPFKLTPDPAYFYPSSTHNEGLLLLDYSIEQKEGFTTVIGDPGSGKTTLLNVFLDKWSSGAEIAIVLTPRLSPEEFLVSILEDLDISFKRKNKNEIIKAFRDFMIAKSSEGRRVIIIVDEAQNLPDETLEELRLLSNLETDKDKLLQIVLLGQPELETKLMSDRLRQLNQRITTRIHLRHFNPDETLDYINYRIIKAGKQNLQLDKKAGRLAYKLSKGIPRLINMLISRALMAAYLEESNIILPRHISHAVRSLNHSEMRLQRWFRFAHVSAGIFAVLLLIFFAVNFYLPGRKTDAFKEAIKKAEINPVQKPSEIVSVTKKNEDNESIISPNPSLQKRGEGGFERSLSQKNTENSSIQMPPEPDTVPKKNETRAIPYKILSVKVDVANVRDEPMLDSVAVGKLLKSDQMVTYQEYLDESGSKWYQVSFRGEKRWISEEVVDVLDVNDVGKSEVQQTNY